YAFIDNIIITSDIAKDYLKYFNTIFTLFIKKNILISLKKSFINFLNVKLLGFCINALGLTLIEERIETMRKLDFPN
ncbi:uncharacterized protein B0T23DRAFT_309579, partial [Neurospora hispaniola]